MNKYELVAFLASVGVTGGVAMTLIISWFRYRGQRPPSAPARDPQQEQRLARIESAVEAIALEVERISEGQRFTTRLLAERHGALGAIGAGEPVSVPVSVPSPQRGVRHAT